MSLSTLTLETLFTRIFSVTLWSQFAYMAISVAMLGLTLGATWVYFRPSYRDPNNLIKGLSQSALRFAAAIPISLLIHLLIPFPGEGSFWGILALIFEFAVLTLPFVFSGINITLALTSYRGHFHKLYAFDLLGAAVGCILFILILEVFDPINAVFAVAAVGLVCAWAYAREVKGLRSKLQLALLLLLGLLGSNLAFGWLDLGKNATDLSGNAWEVFSRIKVVDSGALFVLTVVLVLTFLIYLAFIVLPIAMKFRSLNFRRDSPYFAYFTLLGWGFMLVEMAQLRHLTEFLGNPSYGLTVVLCTLLLATGAGSYLNGRTDRRPGLIRLTALVAVLAILGATTLPIVEGAADFSLWTRIGISVGMLLPMGVLMGTAMPLGMAHAERSQPGLTPWYWGMNGAASVFASVLAVTLLANYGPEPAYWAGLGCYALAVPAFAGIVKRS